MDNEMAKSLILRIICFFCSLASSGETVNQRLEWNKLLFKDPFSQHIGDVEGEKGRGREGKKSNYFPLLSLHSLQIRHAFWEAAQFSFIIAVLPPASSANSHCLSILLSPGSGASTSLALIQLEMVLHDLILT